MLLLLLLLIIPLAITLDYLTKKRRYELTKNIPGPTVLPLIGCPYILLQRDVKGSFEDLATKFPESGGRIERNWLGPYLTIITSDPKDIEAIFNNPKHCSKGLAYDVFKSSLGNGIFTSSGTKWQYRRKLFALPIQAKHFENIVRIADEQCDILLSVLEAFVGKGAFDIYPIISKAAMDIVTESATGFKFHVQTNDEFGYFKASEKITQIIQQGRMSFAYQFESMFKVFCPRLYRTQKECFRIVDKYLDGIITKRKQFLNHSLDKNASVAENDDFERDNENKTYLDILLQNPNEEGLPFAYNDILKELFSGIFAGHDTTASTVPFIFYCISRHSAVQEKLFEEIRHVFNDDLNATIDIKKISQLKYMNMVIKESLRLYPAGHSLSRLITEDSEINGKIFPKGTNVIIPLMRLHRDPEIYPDPLEFRPERFSSSGSINPFAYLPFSAGPRNCLGQKVAMLIIKVALTKIIRKFELLPLGPEPRLLYSYMIRSTNGIYLGIKERVI